MVGAPKSDDKVVPHYWRPEFSGRTSTPEKKEALEKLFLEYNRLFQGTKQLNDEIYSRRFEGEDLKRRQTERDKNIARAKALETEAMLWRQ